MRTRTDRPVRSVAGVWPWRLAGLLGFLLLASPPASADTIESGFIVRIEDHELYFNLGAAQGLKVGAKVRIKRPVTLRHPVTRKPIEDWLPIGDAEVTAVGAKLAMAVVDSHLLSEVIVGDRLEVLVVRKESIPVAEPATEPDQPPPESDGPPPELDPDTREVLLVWQATTGRSLEARIAGWEGYLDRNPESPYAATIHEDLDILRALRERIRPAELTLDEQNIGGLSHSSPSRSQPDQSVPLVFLIDDPEDLAAAWLHYRTRGAASFRKTILRREHDFYLRGEIPADSVNDPGVEYFVEIATHRGNVGAAIGSPDAPREVAVDRPTLSERFAEHQSRSRIAMRTTYLDFTTFDGRDSDHTDAFFWFEADFLYRLRGPVYGIRSGMGVINGEGGYTDRIYDNSHPPPKAGFNYGYTELELRGPAATAFLARLVAGAGRDGFGLGIEGRFRLGREDQTNLSLGAAKLAEIGFLTELRMQWNAVPALPVGLAVAITDWPSGGDVGVRLSTDFGYRLSWFQPTLRVSYQGRTVVHSGLGVGLGLIFDW